MPKMERTDRTERIGKVTLDYTWYPGEDRYSDGAVEDRLLELARTCSGSALEERAVKECGWAGLYHFSHIRRNILSWLPLKKTDRVLEAGSGLGAVTGILAEHAGSVTCIDLSRKRSRINAYRNQERENLRILVGNIQDIAANLGETFDLITLIGVFEYAQYSIQSQNPFPDYLAMLRPLLAPGGRLVIAIENRLGMKYWAGAAEDHTGIYFDGLEGYPSTDYVRTFSRPALERLLKEGGFGTPVFYYPYPDYKLPDRLHSDRQLPRKGELNRGSVNMDRVRMETFREELAFDQVTADGLYPVFANSYCVVVPDRPEGKTEKTALENMTSGKSDPENMVSEKAGQEKAVLEKAASDNAVGNAPVYVKFSNERAPEFRIRTEFLLDGDGTRRVRKVPEDPRALSWVRSLADKQKLLEEQLAPLGLQICPLTVEADTAVSDWVEGCTLEELFDRMLREGNTAECEEKMTEFLQQLAADGQSFTPSRQFADVFGKSAADEIRQLQEKNREQEDGACEKQPCAVCSDLDLIFSNIILNEDQKTVIDYEWTFPFSIPAGFLQYRCIRYYIHASTLREEHLQEETLFRALGISGEWIRVYEKMEEQFQQYILGGYCPLWKRREELSPGVIPVLPLVNREMERSRARTVEVFFDDGTGFSQERCRQYHPRQEEAALAIRIPEGTRQIRVDPASYRCVVRVSYLKQGEEALQITQTNGRKNGNGDYVFDTEDPQMVIPVSGTQEVRIRFQTEKMEGLLRDAVLSQNPLVRWAVQTPAWKVWKKLRKSRYTRERI